MKWWSRKLSWSAITVWNVSSGVGVEVAHVVDAQHGPRSTRGGPDGGCWRDGRVASADLDQRGHVQVLQRAVGRVQPDPEHEPRGDPLIEVVSVGHQIEVLASLRRRHQGRCPRCA